MAAEHMNGLSDSANRPRHGLDKLAFLGLLVVGLFAASILCMTRRPEALSPPILLSELGVAVSLPDGKGWHSEDQWSHDDDGFSVSSEFVSRSGGTAALATCRCLPPSSARTPEVWFGRVASLAGGNVRQAGRLAFGNAQVAWAHIHNRKAGLDVFFGTTAMPGSWQMTIEVQRLGDASEAWGVFNAIARSIDLKAAK
jgi:hypothetical protein